MKIKKIKKVLIFSCIALCVGLYNFYNQPPQNDSESISNIQESNQKVNKTDFYKVSRVIDGDTIIVKIKDIDERIRLIGIDTPESVKAGSPVERYGKEASIFTKNLLLNRKVRLEFDVQERDKYRRLLAYVYLEDGRMLNKVLVEEGYAQVMTVPPNIKYQKTFISLQRKAKESNKGLWK